MDRDRMLRRVGLVALVAWAVVVGVAFQRTHPAPWGLWLEVVRRADWSTLAPAAPALALALGRIAVAVGILGAAAWVGRRILGWLWGPRAELEAATTAGERLWLGMVCGLAAYALATIGLAATGLLYVPVLGVLVGAPLLFAVPELVRRIRARGPRPATPRTAVELVILGLIGAALAAAVPAALSPYLLHDTLAYHLALPRAYLEAHAFVAFPHVVFANTPLNMEMLYTIALALGGAPAAKLVHFGCGIGWLGLTMALGNRLFPRPAGALAALLMLTTQLVQAQLPTAYVDVGSGFAFLAAVWCIVHWAQTRDTGALRVGAVALGLFAGMRYTAIYGVAAAGVAVLVVLITQRAPRRAWWITVLTLTAGLLIGAGPWFWKNAVHVGNPVFPLATGVFGLGPLSPTENARMHLLVAQHGMGRAPLDLLLLPWRLTVYGGHTYSTFTGIVTPVWLIALPAIVWWRRRPRGFGLLGVIGLTYWIAWTLSTHVSRYLVPVFPIWSLLAVCSLLRLAQAGPDGRPRARWVFAGIAGAALWWVPVMVPTLLGVIGFGPAAWGRESAEAFILRTEQTARMYAYMEEMLPADAGVVGLWENRGFRCPRRLEPDAVFEAPRWLDRFATRDHATLARDFRAQGLTHMLLNTRHLANGGPRPTSAQDAERIETALVQLKQFTIEYCDEVYAADRLRLYEIRGAP